MKKIPFLVAAILGCGAVAPIAWAQEFVVPAKPPAKPAASLSETELRGLGEGIAFPYEKLERALAPNVNVEGAVFYAKLKGNNDLETFVRAVAIADMTRFPKWMNPPDPQDPKSTASLDRTPELTFLINAYNGLFFKAIADAYPVNSPAQIKGLDSAKTRRVAGKDVSFAELRRQIATIDPRALFALPDGTNAGPRASSKVYSYLGLGAQLNQAANAYVNDLSRVKSPLRLQNMVEVSPWLATVDEYFAPKTAKRKWNGVRNVLSSYTKRDSDQRYFAAGDYQINFSLENGSVNEQLSR
ncbi:Protein of unknown function, DUF547 [Abditibacterium utsteinense]|uniref:DUF547 domain-containing protein n=1 Tax=Abditibacterium utsteinense TaxID=1960156 RepID=A0A2S8SVY9_9BACT|nr:DUF547 domain-containing protein [Abditibacterium utsteinense]PQV64958.1 Protein of unknown function, DUF547 [Abditibacterium utsteinense]